MKWAHWAGIRGIAIAATTVVVWHGERPPPVVGFDAPPQAFSALRALSHLEQVAKKPHSTGSPAAADVREYIARMLRAYGVEVEIQEVRAHSRWIFGRFSNVIGSIAGDGTGGTVLLVAHYDSSPSTPGAGDNGMAVATLLETARALRRGPALSVDVVLLFTDGEEAGHLGMRGYIDSPRAPTDIAAVLNFDAGGTRGPVYLADTSPNNRALIQALAASAPHPRASSVATLLARLEPMTSDFLEIEDAGWPGYYFAHAGNPVVAHSMLDRGERVDARSIQHQGSYALSLARHFGGGGEYHNLRVSRSETTFFSVFGKRVIHYGPTTTLVVAGLCLMLLVRVALSRVARRQATVRGMARGAGLLALVLVVAPALSLLTWAGITSSLEYYGQFMGGYAYRPGARMLLLLGVSSLTFGVAAARALRQSSADDVFLGMLMSLAVLLVASVLFAPGASYLLAWPMLAAGVGLWIRSRGANSGGHPWLLAASLLAVILLVPIIMLFPSLRAEAAQAVTIPVVVLLVFLFPSLASFMRIRRGSVAGVGGLVALVSLASLAIAARFDADHPRTNFLIYGKDVDSGEAVWAGAGSRLDVSETVDPWLRIFLGDPVEPEPLDDYYVFLSKPLMYVAPAPSVAIDAPTLTLLRSAVSAGGRVLNLRLEAPPGVTSTAVHLPSEILSATIDGTPHPYVRSTPVFGFLGVPSEGVEFEIVVPLDGEVRLDVLGLGLGLPTLPETEANRRPAETTPEPTGGLWAFSDATVVRRSYSF